MTAEIIKFPNAKTSITENAPLPAKAESMKAIPTAFETTTHFSSWKANNQLVEPPIFNRTNEAYIDSYNENCGLSLLELAKRINESSSQEWQLHPNYYDALIQAFFDKFQKQNPGT